MKRKASSVTSKHADDEARPAPVLPAPDGDTPQSSDTAEAIDHDHLCPICQLLLYRPVRTRCNHLLCESCMAHWADVSISTQMTTVGLDDVPLLLLPNDVETRCPMCRTPTTASLDPRLETNLQDHYPRTYEERRVEHQSGPEDDLTAAAVETLTVYIGNEHSMIRTAADSQSNNKHQWNFFIRPSRTDLIEEVQIFLHPTFRNSRVIVQYPPYEIRRLGWGFFTIYANIVLRAGYSWVSSDAEDTADGGIKGKLPLEWTLDFNGRGSQGRLRLKVRKEKDGQEQEDQHQTEQVRRLWTRQRENDPDWVDTGDAG